MCSVPREEFLPSDLRQEAYVDSALPIGAGQTISQPTLVAEMTAQLRLSPKSRVLEIGTGSGYQTAILAEVAGSVYSIERIPDLARDAALKLQALGYTNVQIRCGDGSVGWADAAPFDGIIVTAAAESVPEQLPLQLAPGGRMIVPVGPAEGRQFLYLMERNAAGDIERRRLQEVRFVPLIPRASHDS